MGRLSLEYIDRAMNAFGKSVVRRAKSNLTSEKGIASNKLWSSIRYRYARGTLAFSMMFYGRFLDKGVTGTGRLWLGRSKSMPVPYNKSEASPEFSFKSRFKAIGGSLKSWLSAKGMDTSLDYIMRRSVHAKGIRPRRFFTEAFDIEYARLNTSLRKAVKLTVEDYVDKKLKEYGS